MMDRMMVEDVPYARIERIILSGLDELETTRDRLREAPKDAKALHGHRKACRKLDARIDLAHFSLKPTTLAKAHALTARLAAGLGKHRDADVAPERVRDLDPSLQGLCLERPKGRRSDVAQALRRARSKELRAPMTSLLARAQTQASGRPLDLLAARAALRWERADRTRSFHDLHAFRLDLKSLRYGAAALADDPHADRTDARVAGAGELAAEAKEVTDMLGVATDAHMLAEGGKACGAEAAILRGLEERARSATEHAHGELSHRLRDGTYPRLLRALGPGRTDPS